MKISIVLALLMGLTYSTRIQRERRTLKSLADLQVDASTEQISTSSSLTCKTAINNAKAWRGLNATAITSQTTSWTDANFTVANASSTNNALFWSAYTEDTYGIASDSTQITWTRGFTTSWLKSQSILSTDVNYDDIDQGGLGDCYYLSALASLAENDYRLKNAMLTQTVNKAGAFATQIYVKGIPQVVVVDDYLPFNTQYYTANYGYYTYLNFASQAADGSLWGPLMEKTFAKVMGNYEVLNGGSAGETWDFVSGIPNTWYSNTDTTTVNSIGVNAWNILSSAFTKGFIADGAVGSSNNYGLPDGHAYSILGAYQIKAANGTVTNRLIQIRNPWGYDVYTGNWNDDDTTHWTALAKSQVPYVNNSNDGVIFMEDVDFVQGYEGFWVGYYNDKYINNYLEVLSDTGSTQTFTFTTTKAGTNYIGIEFYNPRMYPLQNCHYETYALVYLYTSTGTYLNAAYMYDWDEFNFFEYDSLAAGSYKLTVQVTWDKTYGDNDVKDYTVRIYGDQIVSISNSAGGKSSYNYILTPNTTTTANTTTNTTNTTTTANTTTNTTTTKNTSNTSNTTNTSTASASKNSSSGYSIVSYYLNNELSAYNLALATLANKTYYSEYTGWVTTTGPATAYGKDLIVYVNSTKYNSNLTYSFKNANATIVSTGLSSCVLKADLVTWTCTCQILPKSGATNCSFAMTVPSYTAFTQASTYTYALA